MEYINQINGVLSLAEGVRINAPLNREGCPPILGATPGRGRGVNSQVGEAAGNSPTRFPLETPGPDFNFSARYFWGELVRCAVSFTG